MFSIDYGILEDTKEEIQELSKENFKDNPEIYGQFELKLDNYIIGYVDEEIPFENELVLTWFNFFTESCKNILTNSYSIFCVIDLKDFWLELKKEKNEIRINRKKPIQQEIPFLMRLLLFSPKGFCTYYRRRNHWRGRYRQSDILFTFWNKGLFVKRTVRGIVLSYFGCAGRE